MARLPADLTGYDNAEALTRIRMILPVGSFAELPFPQLRGQLDALLK